MTSNELEPGKQVLLEVDKQKRTRKRTFGAISAGASGAAVLFIGVAANNPVSKDRVFSELSAAGICLFYSYLAGKRAIRETSWGTKVSKVIFRRKN